MSLIRWFRHQLFLARQRDRCEAAYQALSGRLQMRRDA